MDNEGGLPVTVVIPIHDRAPSVEGALASVWAQQPALPRQVIVVDDASTDDGAARAERAGATVMRLEENAGPGAARDLGLAAATEPWCAFLDSDDLWAPGHLAALLSATYAPGPCSLVVSSGISVTGRSLRVTGNPYRSRRRLLDAGALLCPENVVTTSACMVRTDLARRAGGFGTSRIAEDLDLWLRLLDVAPGWALPDITVRYGPAVEDNRPRASADSRHMRRTAQRLVDAHPTISPTTAEGLAACAEWDNMRAAVRARRRREARQAACRLVGLAAWTQLGRMFLHRHACRSRWRSQPQAVVALVGDHPALRSVPARATWAAGTR